MDRVNELNELLANYEQVAKLFQKKYNPKLNDSNTPHPPTHN